MLLHYCFTTCYTVRGGGMVAWMIFCNFGLFPCLLQGGVFRNIDYINIVFCYYRRTNWSLFCWEKVLIRSLVFLIRSLFGPYKDQKSIRTQCGNTARGEPGRRVRWRRCRWSRGHTGMPLLDDLLPENASLWTNSDLNLPTGTSNT